MKQRRNFVDRLTFLSASIGLLVIGGALAYALYAVRGITPETLLTVEMVERLTAIRVFAVPTTACVIGFGLWFFYQALKED